MKNSIGYLLVILALSVAVVGWADDDEGVPTQSVCHVEVKGDYVPLTFYRKLQFASAYFVNGQLTERAQIVELYPLDKLPLDQRQNKLITLVDEMSSKEAQEEEDVPGFFVLLDSDEEPRLTSVRITCKQPTRENQKLSKWADTKLLKRNVYISAYQDKGPHLESEPEKFVSWDPDAKVRNSSDEITRSTSDRCEATVIHTNSVPQVMFGRCRNEHCHT